jgi:hypothetical protein
MALVFTGLSLFLVIGCSEKSSITQPVDEINPTETINKDAEPDWFGLPKPVFRNLQNSFSVKKVIKAEENSSLRIKKDYESETGMCKVDVNVALTKGSFLDDTEITMTLDTETGVITFSPQINLERNALIDIKIINIDLSGSKNSELDFVYLRPDGNYESIVRHSIKKKVNKGELSLQNGVLPRLSSCSYITKEINQQ